MDRSMSEQKQCSIVLIFPKITTTTLKNEVCKGNLVLLECSGIVEAAHF
jgi:hypothetical protein